MLVFPCTYGWINITIYMAHPEFFMIMVGNFRGDERGTVGCS